MPGVLVFCEVQDGKLKKASREALSIGRKLAEAEGGDLTAFASDKSAADDAGRYGAKKLFVADAGGYNTETYTAAMQAAIALASPSIVLFGGTSASVPAIATTRINAFPAEESGGGAAEVVEVSAPAESKAKVVETKVTESGELSIVEADIIVSGGRGLKEGANFSLIRDLAHAIGGAVGASRATVDAGWIDHQHQVGQTGRVVSPNLYIAAGVSGAIQHLAGMSSSKHIVAINKDPEAPIFRIADFGVVGNLFTILPALTEEVKKAKAH